MPVIVDRTLRLRAPAAEVFSLVSDHARLPEWAPGVVCVEIDGRGSVEGGAGTVRTLVPRFGKAGQEVVHELDRTERRLRYGATDASLALLCRSHRATISCRSEAGGTVFRFQVEAEPWSAVLFVVARWMFALAVSASFHNLARRFGRLRDGGG